MTFLPVYGDVLFWPTFVIPIVLVVALIVGLVVGTVALVRYLRKK